MGEDLIGDRAHPRVFCLKTVAASVWIVVGHVQKIIPREAGVFERRTGPWLRVGTGNAPPGRRLVSLFFVSRRPGPHSLCWVVPIGVGNPTVFGIRFRNSGDIQQHGALTSKGSTTHKLNSFNRKIWLSRVTAR